MLRGKQGNGFTHPLARSLMRVGGRQRKREQQCKDNVVLLPSWRCGRNNGLRDRIAPETDTSVMLNCTRGVHPASSRQTGRNHTRQLPGGVRPASAAKPASTTDQHSTISIQAVRPASTTCTNVCYHIRTCLPLTRPSDRQNLRDIFRQCSTDLGRHSGRTPETFLGTR